MNVEKLKLRLNELEEQMKQLLANYNACEGAKQEILIWLSECSNESLPESQL
jgi:hypothetical protein